MSSRAAASLAEIVLRSAVTGWIAALYGALYIYAKADFATTGSLWIFGWPFCVLLTLATLMHLLLVGGGGRRLPSPVRWVNIVNRVLADDAAGVKIPSAALGTALVRLPGFPAVDACWAFLMAGSVVVAMAILEWWVAGSTRNLEPILVGGLIATMLYGAMCFTVTETLVSRPCRRLRSVAAGVGLDPYVGPTLTTPTRIVTLAAPTVLALVVAPPLVAARGSTSAAVAHALIVVLGTALCVGLAWLHAVAIREAAADLGHAAQELVGKEGARFITGTIDTELVGMARAFNRAASHVDRSLQISAARYAALFEGAGDAILLIEPTTGRVLEANRRALELTGLGEVAIKTAEIQKLFAAATPLEDVRRLPAGTYRWAGMRIQRADGSQCPVDVTLSTVAVGDDTVLQAILHDVGARERIEAELRQSVQRLEGLYNLALTLGGTVEQVAEHIAVTLPALLEVPAVAVVRYDGDEQIVLALYEDGTVTHDLRMPRAGTPATCLGADRRPCVFTDAAARFPNDPFLASRATATYVGVPVLARDGEVAGHVAVMDERVRRIRDQDMRLLSTFAGRLARALHEDGYAREREDFIARLTTQNRELHAAQERLTEADRLKSEFMGMMSHELRTPLNIFLGYTELMLDGIQDGTTMPVGEQRDVLGRMLDAARTLTRLVEDTLSVLRLEGGGVRVLIEDVSLPVLFDELQGAERRLRASSVREQWSVDPGVPSIPSDRMKLRQILTNLVGNARKFTREGSITVRAHVVDQAWIAISVADTGCGIAPADVPHVFELYRQAANGWAHDGCGIGLYIVRRYCELLGGRVEVESAVGLGTCFTLVLPARARDTLTRDARPAA